MIIAHYTLAILLTYVQKSKGQRSGSSIVIVETDARTDTTSCTAFPDNAVATVEYRLTPRQPLTVFSSAFTCTAENCKRLSNHFILEANF